MSGSGGVGVQVLITGGSGQVAGQLLPGLVGRYDVRGCDLVDGDLSDAHTAAKLVDGADAVVHLAAVPEPDASWADLIGPNIRAVTNVLAAAGRAKVVLASSIHVMGLHRGRPVEPHWPPAPCCAYGATKAFAEAAARAHSHRHGNSVICLRLGATTPTPQAGQSAGAWLAPADLQQLVVCALETPVRFGIYHGVSANSAREWSTTNDIGYRPVCDAATHPDPSSSAGVWEPCQPEREL